jgi:hypothetical protein
LRGGATSASLFKTWLILFGYSFPTQAIANFANRSAAAVSKSEGAATIVAGIASSSMNRKIDIDKMEIVAHRTIFKRSSRERTLAACWSPHSAATNFSCGRGPACEDSIDKFAIAECDRPHAGSVRSPEICVPA